MRWTIEKMPRFQELQAQVSPSGAAANAANELAETVRDHVERAAATRHSTASRLGATPKGHLSEGAAKIHMEKEGGRAVVTVPIPGITRAFHALHIRPRTSKPLTIPINAVAYGMRAPELAERGWSLFSLPAKEGPGAGILFGRKAGARSTVALYLLRESADVPQDRGLMPSDEEMGEALAIGVRDAIERDRRVGA